MLKFNMRYVPYTCYFATEKIKREDLIFFIILVHFANVKQL